MQALRFFQCALCCALLLGLMGCGESATITSVATQGGETAVSSVIPTSDGEAVATPTTMQVGEGTPCPSNATFPPGGNSTTATIQSATNVPATTTLGAMTDIPLGTTIPNDPCIQLPADAQSSPTP
ncbi:hypothetical protein [Herpetosiphon geysericola]|nr:hypothetical protein [Herpetosiphon geysericola]